MIDDLEKNVEMLERHLQVLQTIVDNEPIGIEKISLATDHPRHKVRYSLHVLEEETLVEQSDCGTLATEQVGEFIQGYEGRIDDLIDHLERTKITRSPDIKDTPKNDEFVGARG